MKYRFTGFVCLVGLLLVAPTLASREVEPLKIGAQAPDFDLPGVDGRNWSLSDFKDAKLLMVIFTCNHCPTAQAYEQRIIDLHREYKPKGVALVAISPNDDLAVRLDELGYSDLGDSLEDMKVRAEDRGFEFPYLYDGDTQETSAEFGVLATPHVYIFDEQRTLRYVGRFDDQEVREPTSHDARRALDELLAGQDVSVPQTRVFGCSTKWSDKRQSAIDALAKWNREGAELQSISPEKLKRRLTDKSEKYRLVNVWATWCAPCIAEMDDLVTIHRMYRNRPFELITVSADFLEMHEAAQKVLAEKNCSASNYILDTDSRDALFDAVDSEWQGAIPYTVLISPDGEILHRVSGQFDPLKLRRVIVDHIGRTYASK